jgi:large subunit ribosomal protein L10
MNREQKATVVDEIAAQLKAADAVFAVDYRGISVPQAAALRARLRDADATFRVVKNRLTLRAAEQAGADSLRELLEGPTALTFVRGDAALAAKALHEFARAGDALEFKGGLLGEQTLSVEEIRSIALLPARDVLHAQLVGTVAAPLTGLVRGLNGLIAGLAIQLRQIQEQELVGGGAEDAAPAAEDAAPGAEDAAPGAEDAAPGAVPVDEVSMEAEAPPAGAPEDEAPVEAEAPAEAPADEASEEAEAPSAEAPEDEAPLTEAPDAEAAEDASAADDNDTDNQADASAAADEAN